MQVREKKDDAGDGELVVHADCTRKEKVFFAVVVECFHMLLFVVCYLIFLFSQFLFFRKIQLNVQRVRAERKTSVRAIGRAKPRTNTMKHDPKTAVSLNQEQLWENDRLLVICEFLETIVQSILYVRGIYPSDMFEKVITPCTNQMTFAFRAKEMRQYIGNCILSMKPWLRHKLVHSVVVRIVTNVPEVSAESEKTTHNEPSNTVLCERTLEQFVFEMKLFQMNVKELQADSAALFGKLYWTLRDFYVKVHAMNGQYNNVYLKLSEQERSGLSFRIQTNVVNNSAHLDLTNKLDWLVVERKQEKNHQMSHIDGACDENEGRMTTSIDDNDDVDFKFTSIAVDSKQTTSHGEESSCLLIPLKSVLEVDTGLHMQLFIKQQQ